MTDVVRLTATPVRARPFPYHGVGIDPYVGDVAVTDRSEVRVLNGWLKKIVIGEPVVSWLMPEVAAEMYTLERCPVEVVVLRVTIHTGDANGALLPTVKAKMKPGDTYVVNVHFRTAIPAVCALDRAAFVGFVHHCLSVVMQHELDECFRVDGAVPFDPHA